MKIIGKRLYLFYFILLQIKTNQLKRSHQEDFILYGTFPRGFWSLRCKIHTFPQDSSLPDGNYKGMIIEVLKSNLHVRSAITARTISLQAGREPCACLSIGRAVSLAGKATRAALNLPQLCPIRVIWLIEKSVCEEIFHGVSGICRLLRKISRTVALPGCLGIPN